MKSAKDILDLLEAQKSRYVDRDARWDNIRSAREGEMHRVAPDMFSTSIPRSIVANFIDTVARDLAELIAPLPAFQCSSTTMQSDTARKFADKRSKIVQNYISHARLDRLMYEGADHYSTYSVAVLYLEPDFEGNLPRVCIEDPIGGYPDLDRFGRVRSYTKRFCKDAYVLAQMFPEFSEKIHKCAKETTMWGSNLVEIIRYCDGNQITLILQGKEPLVLANVANPLGETPIVLARRAWLHGDKWKGQFDDAIWVQMARDVLARLNLEAVEKSVQAPLAVPSDVQEFPVGPDSIIRAQDPSKIQRVGIELPQGAFAESAVLMEELRTGTRYPAARSGGVDASIITGRGVQALLGGFETQVRAAQMAFRDAFQEVIRLALKMDEIYWPNLVKSVRGQRDGVPYEIRYTPKKDIAGDYTCDVEYGFAAGMDPNRSIVMLLQLRGDKLISRDYFQRQLPFPINVTEEQTKVDVEEIREAIKQGVFGFVQAIPALAQSGMDPSEPMLKAAQMVKAIQKGEQIEDVVTSVFAPAPEPPAEGGLGDVGAGGSGPSGAGAGAGLTPSGRLTGVSPGQAGQAPGGRPDLSVMLAGLTGQGAPQMSAYTMRRRRI